MIEFSTYDNDHISCEGSVSSMVGCTRIPFVLPRQSQSQNRGPGPGVQKATFDTGSWGNNRFANVQEFGNHSGTKSVRSGMGNDIPRLFSATTFRITGGAPHADDLWHN